ncbi:hypothetical protein PYW07_017422 [Mythimna separata]|uniref:Dynein heavy chain AAA module D4 domain-containing protein n=1 Tax=Mythimna separata TaxID=271217 RepID=A0AAD8DYK2_MYTSE|nr:hypothetical protein PYW07_017422 [Mythimna separata]
MYVERVKIVCLRIVLAMSPIGDSFRNRLRMFPSLINCATIDWFTAWPAEALERVAHMFIYQMEDVEDELRLACVDMCQLFHMTVVQLSERSHYILLPILNSTHTPHMFIYQMEDVEDELRLACVDMCQLFHMTVVQLSERSHYILLPILNSTHTPHMFIYQMEDVEDELRLACVDMCQLFHMTVVQLSERSHYILLPILNSTHTHTHHTCSSTRWRTWRTSCASPASTCASSST